MNTPSLKVINDYSRDQSVFRFFKIDWLLLVSAVLISIAGLVTMNSFTGENSYFDKQVIWISISVAVFFCGEFVRFSVFKKNIRCRQHFRIVGYYTFSPYGCRLCN